MTDTNSEIHPFMQPLAFAKKFRPDLPPEAHIKAAAKLEDLRKQLEDHTHLNESDRVLEARRMLFTEFPDRYLVAITVRSRNFGERQGVMSLLSGELLEVKPEEVPQWESPYMRSIHENGRLWMNGDATFNIHQDPFGTQNVKSHERARITPGYLDELASRLRQSGVPLIVWRPRFKY